MEKEMTLFDAISRAEEMVESLQDDLKITEEVSVAKELKQDLEAIRKLQQAAWVILLGKTTPLRTGGMKCV